MKESSRPVGTRDYIEASVNIGGFEKRRFHGVVRKLFTGKGGQPWVELAGEQSLPIANGNGMTVVVTNKGRVR